jgi:hypothetical protein
VDNSQAIFDFELDFAGALYCIPMSVRLKLDNVGVKVSLKQWNKLTRDERAELLARPCDTGPARQAYKGFLTSAIEARTGTRPQELPIDAQPQWDDAAQVPGQVSHYFVEKGLAAMTQAQWAELTPLQRFALIKLTRPGHSNNNFMPALKEFGVLAG